jgi:hypothetical protein
MSDEEHCESEFYYPEIENEGYESVFCQFNEVQYNNVVYSYISFELIWEDMSKQYEQFHSTLLLKTQKNIFCQPILTWETVKLLHLQSTFRSVFFEKVFGRGIG